MQRMPSTISSEVVMSRGPWYGSSLDAKEARIAKPLNTCKEINTYENKKTRVCVLDHL